MASYRGRGSFDEIPSVDWDEIFRRPLPDLRRPFIIIVLVALVWLFFSLTPRLYTDYRWFEELGFTTVFITELSARVTIFLAASVGFFLFYAINILIARRLTPRVNDESSRLAQVAAFAGRSINFLLLAGGLALAVIVGTIAQAEWLTLLRYQSATLFNVRDPIFNQDVAFYTFTVPVYESLISWLGGILVLTIIATAVTYALGLGQMRWINAVKAHLSALGAGILLLSAWNYQIEMFKLVYSQHGVVFGAGYTEVNAQVPAYAILTYITLGLAALLLINIFARALRAIGAVVALWIVAGVLLGNVYPAFVQNFEVKPSEFTKEQPYLKHNIALTRQAYALDKIQDLPFPAEDAPTPADIAKNSDTIANIRLSDYRPLLQTYNQIQSIRTYYDFLDVDVDRYTIDGKYRQVMISARELAPTKLAQKAQTWVNLHLLYTHGHAAVTSPVNEFTPDGLPKLLTKDIPSTGVIPITRPELYFGEEQSTYVFVKSREKEFDYPKGDENAFSTYTGTGGVSIASLFDRVMFALRFGDLNILLTDAFTPDTRVLFNRRIQARVDRIAPFLRLDKDPYPVLADGKMFWIQDAYTYTDRFPYSDPYEPGLNYIRNSVKIVIDAYNGTTAFYAIEPNEPILHTYASIFPALFKPYDQMPAALRDHVRYPEGLFTIQAAMYRTYHMQDPQVFYNREDLWAIPNEAVEGSQARAMEPYYVIMRLPGESKEEFMLMLPFAAARRQNMVAWMSVKSDGADYGKTLVYRFPKDKLVYGPEQIHARLNQDPAISSELTLINQRGSRVLWGNLLVIPIEKSLLYVQPLYLLSEQGQIPQLKRVVVATATSLSMQPSLAEALTQVFTSASVAATTPPAQTGTPAPNATVANLIKDAVTHYNKAQDALKIADWTTYGNEMKLLQQILLQLQQTTGQTQ